jgi:prolyl 4-hydroxylase
MHTLIFYLSDVDEGGSTYFPQMKLAIHPKKRAALMFSYMGKDGVLDMRSEHAGMPVIKGDKWIVTKWIREKPISQPPVKQWENNAPGAVGPGVS